MDDFIMKLSQLVGGNLWLAPLIALLAGLLTSLTPCSLSTIPLILGCVGGLNEHEPKKAFRLSLTFAFGSMLTFTALGFAASLLGNLLNGLGPWLHLALALLLIAMLAIVANRASMLYGVLLLIIFSVGHGVLSVVAGTSAGFVNRLMDSPRYVKAEKIVRIVLGIIILLAAAYLLSEVISEAFLHTEHVH